jgi:SAM-dependent methyltransferase
MAKDHVEETIATYNRIAADYALTATPELRAWEERSMDIFRQSLRGRRVLVPGCGDGRDSRYLAAQDLDVLSFDLSTEMLNIARREDPGRHYLLADLRYLGTLDAVFDGIWANGCLYHLRKSEFATCIDACRDRLVPGGILYLSMKLGRGERLEPRPLPGYPGGEPARWRLQGNRFYAYYTDTELLGHFHRFEVVRQGRIGPGRAGLEYWLRKPDEI